MASLLAAVGLYFFFLLSQEALAVMAQPPLAGSGNPDPTASVLAPARSPTRGSLGTATSTFTPTATLTATSTAMATTTTTSTATLIATSTSTATTTTTSTATLTATPSATPSIPPTATAIPTGSPTFMPVNPTTTPSVPVSRTVTLPTASFELAPSAGLLASEGLWGIEQNCTAGPIVDPGNSIDLAFNDRLAWCGPFGDGDTWTYTALQDTAFPTIARATLDVRFYVTGLSNDQVALEVNNGLGWQLVASFLPGTSPPAVLTTLSYEVSSLFTTQAQVNAAQVRFLVSAHGPADPIVIYLDEARLRVDDVIPTPTPFPPLPTPTLPPPLPTDPPYPGDPHVDYAATTSSCAGCHRTHTAGGIVLRQTWPEENVCFACHAGGGPGTDVLGAFANHSNTETLFFKHDVAATNGVHRLGQTAGADFGGTLRHVECEDCHEPHDATRGGAGPPVLQREMTHAPGVDPLWSDPGAPLSFTWLPQAEREYQVCFKCHSSFTALPTYIPGGWDGSGYVADGLRKLTYSGGTQVPDSRDLAAEFNPYNASFHPVVAPGRNRHMPAGSFVPGWSVDSMVYCTDCHANANSATEGQGPHGSPLLHLLAGSADYQTADPDAPIHSNGVLCFDCHDQADYLSGGSDTNFLKGNANLHRQHSDDGTCYLCHDTHGSEQLHLLNLDISIQEDSDTYLLPGYDGQPTNSQTFWQISPDASEKTCWLVCHSHDHSSSPYPNLGD